MYKKRPAILFFLAILFSPITQALTINEADLTSKDFATSGNNLGSLDLGKNSIIGRINPLNPNYFSAEDIDSFAVDLGSFKLDSVSVNVTDYSENSVVNDASSIKIQRSSSTGELLKSYAINKNGVGDLGLSFFPGTADSTLFFEIHGGRAFTFNGPYPFDFNYELTLNVSESTAPVPLPPAVWLLGSAMVFLLRKRKVK